MVQAVCAVRVVALVAHERQVAADYIGLRPPSSPGAIFSSTSLERWKAMGLDDKTAAQELKESYITNSYVTMFAYKLRKHNGAFASYCFISIGHDLNQNGNWALALNRPISCQTDTAYRLH